MGKYSDTVSLSSSENWIFLPKCDQLEEFSGLESKRFVTSDGVLDTEISCKKTYTDSKFALN